MEKGVSDINLECETHGVNLDSFVANNTTPRPWNIEEYIRIHNMGNAFYICQNLVNFDFSWPFRE